MAEPYLKATGTTLAYHALPVLLPQKLELGYIAQPGNISPNFFAIS